MKAKVMRLLLWLMILMFNTNAFSQSFHFIYIQSESKQAFNIQVNDKIYGSSGTGYLIIPQLKAGEYYLQLVFPDKDRAEGFYRVVININDVGLNLKKQNDSWVLENLLSKTIIKATNIPAPEEKQKQLQSDNKFGEMLSQVVNDPNLLKSTKEKIFQKNSADSSIEAAVVATDEEDSIDVNTSGVIKSSQDETDKGTNMVFVDFNQRSSDTVRIFIPNESVAQEDLTPVVAKDTIAAVVSKPIIDSLKADTAVISNVSTYDSSILIRDTLTTNKPVADSVAAVFSNNQKDSISNVFAATDMNVPVKDSVDNPFHKSLTDTLNKQPQPSAFINKECKGLANGDDFLRLRKKMAALQSLDNMVQAAKKAFKTKCYTTEQVKNLGSLFLNDQARYIFYEAAYPFIFDPGNYSILEEQLLDDYYKKRFRALIR